MPATKACAESGRRPAHFALELQSGEAKARRRRLREFRRHRYRTFLLQAHDPPKCERFGDKIMRRFNVLERAFRFNPAAAPQLPSTDQARCHVHQAQWRSARMQAGATKGLPLADRPYKWRTT